MSEKTRVIGTAGGALGLGALRGSTEFPRLDSHVFAQQVQTLLAQLPTSTGTAALAHQARQ
jgi:hypothetical protein